MFEQQSDKNFAPVSAPKYNLSTAEEIIAAEFAHPRGKSINLDLSSIDDRNIPDTATDVRPLPTRQIDRELL